MKTKHLLFVISFIFSLHLFAGNITIQQAKTVAVNFYYEKFNQFEGYLIFDQIAIQSVYKRSDDTQNFYYVFHINKGGYVMVSANDCLNPVLGYSFSFKYETENQPANLKWWLQQYVDQVKYAKEMQLIPEDKIAQKWAFYLNEEVNLIKSFYDAKEVEPLITSLWDQDVPYNLMCPEDPAGPGGHALTGCVATVYAQMIYYWRYPLHGSGYHCYVPENNPQYGELCADFENTWYSWNEICDDPQTSNMAIAELMYQVGVAVDMNYGPSSSGAMGFPEQIEPYFNISTDYDSLRRDFYSNSQWTNIILDQLNQKYPVSYTGFTSNMSSGHMWACDGYQDSTHFHMNWGWGGLSNGYYSLDNLQGFNTFQFLGINFYPDTINYTYPNYASGADTLTSFEGSIEDGSGPKQNYLINTEASWLIDPQTEYDSVTTIIVNVVALDLFNDGDRLYIYDGADNSAPLLAELNGNSLPSELESIGNKIFVEFISDGANTANGFYLNYKTIQPDWCSGNSQLTEPTATISDGSGSFYYYNSTFCSWLIDPGIEEPLTLHFNYFNTEEGNDVMTIRDGGTQQVIAEISGNYEIPPEPVIASSGIMLISFMSNTTGQDQGWEAWYDMNTGIDNYTRDFNLQILPNPVTSDINITFNLTTSEQVNIQVFDIVGQKMKSITNKTYNSGQYKIHGNLNHLPEGVYFCHLQVGNEVITKKIIKL